MQSMESFVVHVFAMFKDWNQANVMGLCIVYYIIT